MAKGVLNKVDLSQEEPQKGSNLSYAGIKTPVDYVRPSAGLLKQVLSRSKESEQFSPYKKTQAPKPTKIAPQTPTPSPQPVQAKPILTQDVLEPIAPMEERVSKKPEGIVTPKTPEKPFQSVMEPIEAAKDIAVEYEGKVRDRINQMADALYESNARPDKAKDVWKSEINTGLKEGYLHTVVDENGNIDIKRKAPSALEALWEGQASVGAGLREGSLYQFENEEDKKIRLENTYKDQMSSLQEDESTATNVYRTTGGVVGQAFFLGATQALSRIPIIGGAIKKASIAAMAASQDLQSEQEAYNIARQQNLGVDDAFGVAQKGRLTYLTTSIAESYVSNLVSGRLIKAGANASTAGKGFIQASKQFLKATGSKSAELSLDATVAAVASVIRDYKLEESTGTDVDIKERALDNAIVEIAAGGALTGLGVIYGQGKQYLPKWFKSQSINMASNLDRTYVENSLKELQSNGQIDEAGVKQALEDIDNWKETKTNNPDIPEEKAPTLIGYFTQKQKLEQSLKKADESSQPAILKKIEDINNKIAEARSNPEPLATEQDDIIQEPIVKTEENATTISKGQEGPTTSGVSEYQGVEGEQAQTTNEADNRNRPISGKTQQELEVEPVKEIPKVFNNDEGKTVFAKMNTAAENKLKKRPGNTRASSSEAVKILKNSSWYKSLTDIQKDAAVRNAVKYFGEKVPSSPSVARLFGQIEKEITVKEKTALKRLMKFGEESATGAMEFSKATRESINAGLKELGKRGIIKVNQLNAILGKYNDVNLESEKSIGKFVDYASNIIKDANYAAKLKEANGLRDAITRNANRKNAQVNLSNTAKSFAQINPAEVDDISKYIGVAGNVLKGIKVSKANKNLAVDFAQSFSDKDINQYTESQKAFIEESLKQEKMSDYQDLVDAGVISADMPFSEMEQIITKIEENSKEPTPKDKERNIRAYINRRFGTLSSIIKTMIDKGTDGFGNRTEDIDPGQEARINEILDRGIEKMPLRDAYRIVEAFDNFITNGKTSGLDAIIAKYDANVKAEDLNKAKVRSRPLKLVFSTTIGKAWSEAFDSVPIKLVRMFGTTTAPKIQRAMGLSDLEVNKTKAVRTAYDTEMRFVKDFKGKQANGDSYDSSYNITEQGMLGFMRRNNGGDETDMQNEFNRRKGLIEESIEALRNENNDLDNKKADLYQEAYDKILAESNNISDIESKVDPVNKEVVDWWTAEWAKHYDKLRDVTINVYNQDLGKDNNYNPDVYKRLNFEEENVDLFNNSAFSYDYDYIPQKKSGVLIKSERPQNLPDKRYIDLSFSYNNKKALKAALTDVYTAKDVRKVDAFLKADATAKIINSDDLKLLRSSISDYVKRSRGMEGVDINEFTKVQRVLSSGGRFITSATLGSLSQPFKQTVPLIIKTMINTNGNFALKESLALAVNSKSPVNQFLNDAGYGISIRGIESSTGISDLENYIKSGTESNFNKVMNTLDKWNQWVLKYTVSNQDKWVARASWITYYKKALNDAGINTSKIDWSTHQVVPEAADYAQSMIDTQQNVSDRDLMGKFMGSRNANVAAARSLLMPFSGFSMNAKSKMQADIINFLAKTSSKEERIASSKSLAGSLSEQLIFNAVQAGIGIALWESVKKYMGIENSKREDEKIWEQALKSGVSNLASDILSPVPQTNVLVNMGINAALDQIDQNTPDELKFRLYADPDQKWYQDFGLLGIGAKKAIDLGTTVKESATGQFEQEAYGKKSLKKISDQDRDMLQVAAMMQGLYALRIIPLAEMGNIANKITRYVEKRALTEKQDIISQVVAEQKVEGATVKVDGEDISKALSKAVAYKDPEARASYLIKLSEQYKDDFLKALDLAEESKILDKPTVANFLAKKGGNQDEIDVARLFSYKDQESRVFKLMNLRAEALKNDRLLEFYQALKFGMQFKLLNEKGILGLADKLNEFIDADSEEVNLLIQAVEEE